MWVAHVITFVAFLVMLPTTKLRHALTSPANMALALRDRPKGAMREMPNLMEATDIETVGAARVGGVHLEAVARHRRLHDVRPMHVGVPGQPHRQAARPPRDRPQARRGGGCQRLAGGVAAGGRRCRDHGVVGLGVRADHGCRAVGLHHLPGLRRDLPGGHRDRRQDPRHAPLPGADGSRLPGAVGVDVHQHGELVQPLRDEPAGPGGLDQGASTSR